MNGKTFFRLEPLTPLTSASAVGINRNGIVVGSSYHHRGLPHDAPRATCWAPWRTGYNAEEIGPENTVGWQINDLGEILMAQVRLTSSMVGKKNLEPLKSYLWRRSSQTRFDFSTLLPSDAIVTGINNRGEFVGRIIQGTNVSAFRGDFRGRYEVLPKLTTSGTREDIRPSGIDDFGRIAGCSIQNISNYPAAAIYWLPDGGNTWQDIHLNAVRFQTDQREAKGELGLPLESQFVRITNQGILLASRGDPSGDSVAYYLDLNDIPWISPQIPGAPGPGATQRPLAVPLRRVHPAAAKSLNWSRIWDAAPSCLVGEESSDGTGTSTLHFGGAGHHLRPFYGAQPGIRGFDEFNDEYRAIAVNVGGLIVVNGAVSEFEVVDSTSKERQVRSYDRPYLISIPEMLSRKALGGTAVNWIRSLRRSTLAFAQRQDVFLVSGIAQLNSLASLSDDDRERDHDPEPPGEIRPGRSRRLGVPTLTARGPDTSALFAISDDSVIGGDCLMTTSTPTTLYPLGGRTNDAVTAVFSQPNRLNVFVVGTDDGIYHKDGSASPILPSNVPWDPLGGKALNSIAAVVREPNFLDLFVRGTDDVIYHERRIGNNWEGRWRSLGGRTFNAVTAVSWGPNRLDLFVRGTDDGIYHKSGDGADGHWRPWRALGGKTRDAVAAVSWGPNRLDLFVRGTDEGIYHMSGDGTDEGWWPSWIPLGGKTPNPVTAVSWGPGRVDLFVRGTDDVIYHKFLNGNTWEPSGPNWKSLGGKTKGSIAAAALPGRLHLAVLGIDNKIYHKWWDGGRWQPTDNDWQQVYTI